MHRRAPLVVLAIVGLLLIVGGRVVGKRAGALDTPPEVKKAGEDFPINQKADTLADISAHNSPSVARNPTDPGNLVVADRIDTPFFACGLHTSSDEGRSWSDSEIPIPRGEEPKCFAPEVEFDSNGTLYVLFVTLQGLGNTPHAAWLSTSADGGRSLSEPAKILDDLAFGVNLMVDPKDSEKLHLTWLQASTTGSLALPETGNPILYRSSDDGGRTWDDPVPVSDPHRERVVAPSPALGPDGEIYVAYLDLGEDRLDYDGGHQGLGGEPFDGRWQLVVASSLEDGKAWRNVVAEDDLVPTQRFIVFLPPVPGLAVSPVDGTVYATFVDGRLGDADVFVWRSEDRGESFSAPVRVNDTERKDGTDQYLPRIDVAGDGRLDVVYYDRRGDAKNVKNEVSFHSSFDGAQTFTRRLVLSGAPFDSRIGFGSERGMPELGSRLGLISGPERSFAAWSDTRGSNIAANKQNIFGSFVDYERTATVSAITLDRMRLGGRCAVALGALMIAMALILQFRLRGRTRESDTSVPAVEDVRA